MIELRQFSRTRAIQIPDWAIRLGAHPLSVMSSGVETSRGINSSAFKNGFAITVPLMDTTIYLDYLANRFLNAGGEIFANVRLEKLEAVEGKFDLVINCAGIGARELVQDADLEPHRGQVASVPKSDN